MIKYKDIEPSEIAVIKNLWIRNKEYHIENERVFKDQYRDLVFEDRMDSILKNEKDLKITIAIENEEICGYCISKINDNVGEVMSLHVLDTKRKKGIGKELTKTHLDWMKKNNCSSIGLYVASGNENTIRFYEQFGLRSNLTYMQLMPEA